MGYLTTQAFDGAGNLVRVTQFANANIGGGDPAGWHAPSADDRTMVYSYDLANNKISQTQVNAVYSTAPDASATVGNLTTTFGYDALGNSIRTTDALGNSTYTY